MTVVERLERTAKAWSPFRCCPVHGEDASECSVKCRASWVALNRVQADLQSHWRDRRLGVQPCRNPMHEQGCRWHCARPTGMVNGS